MNNQIVTSGTISGTTVSSGDLLTINANAYAYSILVDGGQETSFGTASGTTVEQGGSLTISGGVASNTTISGGGDATVVSGGTISGVSVLNNGTFVALSSGVATDLTVSSGGLALIDAGASASAIGVRSGGVLVISPTLADTTVTNVVVDNGGYVVLEPGPGNVAGITGSGSIVTSGIALIGPGGSITTYSKSSNNLDVGSGTTELVLSAGIATSGTVEPGASQQIFNGGSADSVVLSHSFQTVNSGGSAQATVVSSGSAEYVYSGGSASATTVNSGGYAFVNFGGTATDTVVNSGGVAAADGNLSNTTVNNGGEEIVVSSGLATGTTLHAGGNAYVFGSASGTQIGSGGYEVVEGEADGEIVSSGGILLGGYPIPLMNSPPSPPPKISCGIVSSGGVEVLFSGARAVGTTIENGGTFIPLPGASAQNMTIESGATVVSTGVVVFAPPASVSLSNSVTGLTLTSGMSDYVLSGGIENATTIGNHGFSDVESGGTAIDTTIEGGGTLFIASHGTATGTIAFSGAGGTLDIGGSSPAGVTVDGFAPGDDIIFNALQSGTASVTLLPTNILQVSSGAAIEQLQLDPNQNFSQSTFLVSATDSGAVVTVSQSSTSSSQPNTGGNTTPVDIPLYIVPFDDGYKIGIQVSLDGGATYRMYEFDTGGTGFYAAYSPSTWSSFSAVNPAPVVNTYASGNTYTAQVVSTNVTFQTTTGQIISVNNANVGLITAADNPGTFTTQGWNTDLTGTPSVPPLQGAFYGDFGMSLRSGLGLDAILPQLTGGLANGFIITLGAYPNGINGHIGDVQVGLTQADINSFSTIISMQGQNTLDPFPSSGEPTYTGELANGPITLSNTSAVFSALTNFIFDTGTPTMRIYQGTTITSNDLAPFLDSNGNFLHSTNINTTSPPATASDFGWVLNFQAGNSSGQNQVKTGPSASSSSPGSVNTGLNPFFGYRIMYDVADGIMGFEALACFAAGTRILTSNGEVPVEVLQPGDEVITIRGEALPIIWIGRRTIDLRRHPSPGDVLPVRILANAFGTGLPKRDLYLSPDHALFLEDALIPVKYLLNETTVAQVHANPVTYFHVELARHEVILAEGMAAETYLETGHRSAFENGGAIVQAHPVFVPGGLDAAVHWEAFGYAPLQVRGPAVEQAKRNLRRNATRAEPASARVAIGHLH